MADEALPEDVERFIARHINSVEKLEILLLLAAERERPWSPAEVVQRIQSSVASVQQRLKELQQGGLLASTGDGQVRFAPGTAGLEASVAHLKEAYHERRIKVIEAIYNPRKDALQLFSDVFRIRKDNE